MWRHRKYRQMVGRPVETKNRAQSRKAVRLVANKLKSLLTTRSSVCCSQQAKKERSFEREILTSVSLKLDLIIKLLPCFCFFEVLTVTALINYWLMMWGKTETNSHKTCWINVHSKIQTWHHPASFPWALFPHCIIWGTACALMWSRICWWIMLWVELYETIFFFLFLFPCSLVKTLFDMTGFVFLQCLPWTPLLCLVIFNVEHVCSSHVIVGLCTDGELLCLVLKDADTSDTHKPWSYISHHAADILSSDSPRSRCVVVLV